jgi:hypothetical protein
MNELFVISDSLKHNVEFLDLLYLIASVLGISVITNKNLIVGWVNKQSPSKQVNKFKYIILNLKSTFNGLIKEFLYIISSSFICVNGALIHK